MILSFAIQPNLGDVYKGNIAYLLTQVKGSWFFFVCFLLLFLNKGTSYVGLGLTFIASFFLDYLFPKVLFPNIVTLGLKTLAYEFVCLCRGVTIQSTAGTDLFIL